MASVLQMNPPLLKPRRLLEINSVSPIIDGGGLSGDTIILVDIGFDIISIRYAHAREEEDWFHDLD